MELKKKIISIFTVILVFSASIFALEVPALKGYVNDYANIINKNDEVELEKYLKSVEDTTGAQIAVLTIPSLKGEDLAVFSLKAASTWGLGKKGDNNGALLLVALQEREVRIEVGYGLEGLLTDAKCGLIIRNVIIPQFKSGDYSEGILKGVQNMGGLVTNDQEMVSKSVTEEAENPDSIVASFFIIIWLIFIFIVIASKSTRRRRRYIGGVFIPPVHHTHYGGSSFSGGGGFHGGGGSFGGGGASGHW